MTFSEEAKENIRNWTNSDLYRRMKAQVIEGVRIDVIGTLRGAEQVALDLAVKEGVLMAFREMEKLGLPEAQKRGAVLPPPVQKRKPTDK